MIPSLSQEDITQYASNAQTIQEPTGIDYSRGVQIGKTIPAKWWNWLFSNVTKRIRQSRNDANAMLTELKNVVIDAGLAPSSANNTQLTQAVAAKARSQLDSYVNTGKSLAGYWVKVENSNVIRVLNSPEDMFYCYQGYPYIGSLFIGEDLEHMRHFNFSDPVPVGITIIPINAFASTCAVVYFNDQYLCLITSHYSHNDFIYVFASADCRKWELKTKVAVTTNNTSLNTAATIAAFIINNRLYVLRGNASRYSQVFASGHSDLVYTDDGENWTSKLDFAPTANVSPWSEYAYNYCTYEPVHLGTTTKYLIGSNIFDTSDNSITALGSIVSNSPSRFQSPTLKLNNGKILVTQMHHNSSDNCCIVPKALLVDTDGSAIEIDKAINYACSDACGDAGIIMTSKTEGVSDFPVAYIPSWNSSYKYCESFTKDGSNFQNFPTTFNTPEGVQEGEISSVFKLDNKYYISVQVKTDRYYNYLYETTELSSDANDYSLVESDASNTNYGIFPLGVGNTLCRHNTFSSDLGATWHPATFEDGIIGCESVRTRIKDSFYGNGWFSYANRINYSYIPASKQTSSRINRVVGHTLYLR